MQRFGLMSKVIAVVTGVTLAIAALATAFAQPAGIPHVFYGLDGTPGDVIEAVVLHDDHYDAVGSATVDDNGGWSIEVDAGVAEDVVFRLNGEMATAEKTEVGAGQTEVSLTVAMMEDDSVMEDDDSMMEDDDSMMEDDDYMKEDDDSIMEDETMMEEDDEKLATGPPSTGTGGLADNGGISAGLIGLLIALGAAAVAGIGVRRVRNRA
ncbi:MAG: hypothetical protein F4Y11_03330 [Chloroflexi bacterium]|nr:hypothetical protein [Chloroflexota bacterium]